MIRYIVASLVILVGFSIANVLMFHEATRRYVYSIQSPPQNPLVRPNSPNQAVANAQWRSYVRRTTQLAVDRNTQGEQTTMLIREIVIVSLVVAILMIAPLPARRL